MLKNSAHLAKKIIPLAFISLVINSVPAEANEYVNSLLHRRGIHQEKLNAAQAEMMLYVLNNPMPSAAVLASGAGIAATLSDNIDQNTKATLQLFGIAGGIYCFQSQNQQYCDSVISNLAQYGLKLNYYQDQINSLNRQLNYYN